MWALWTLVANVCVIALEAIYRKGVFGSFLDAIIPCSLLIYIGQWGLFNMFKTSPGYFFAGAFFSLMNIIMRAGANHLWLGEPFTLKTVAGLILMLLACLVLK